MAVPLVGALDDAAVVWIGTALFIELCPADVVQEHRDALNAVSSGDSGEIIDAEIEGYQQLTYETNSHPVLASLYDGLQQWTRHSASFHAGACFRDTGAAYPNTDARYICTDRAPATQPPPSASTFPDPSAYDWQPIVSGLERPDDLQADGSSRLFVIEKVGRIRIIQDGQLLPQPFLDITDRVGSQGNEQGLLGLAFHPQYSQNGRFFVNYTNKNGDTVIARYQVSGDPNVGDPDSEVKLLGVDQPYANHNGGVLPSGRMVICMPAWETAARKGTRHGNAQNTDRFCWAKSFAWMWI